MINRYSKRTLGLEFGLILTAVVYLIPILALLNVALKERRNTSSALAISGNYTFANFGFAWTQGQLGIALVNSLAIAVVSVALMVVIGAMAAYPIARVGRNWSRPLYYFFLAGLVIPGQLALLPLFQTMAAIQLTGTIWSVIVLGIGGGMPFTIFLCTTFIRELPRDYEEAALLDGCTPFKAFWLVVVPLIRPALGTVAVLNGLALWNAFLIPLIYLSGSGHETIPVRINLFFGEFSANWPVIFAALAIGSVPILIAYFALQKAFIEAFASAVRV
jgi:raffinose/stachyose/melibiose transport system permease protein